MQSMTGFAATELGSSGRRWRWEAKSVNGRGLDLRFRLADGAEALEPDLRAAASKRFSRGNIAFTLRADEAAAGGAPTLDMAALDAVIAAAIAAEARAAAAGLDLAPASVAQILAIRSVLETASGAGAPDEAALAAVRAGFDGLLDELSASRAAEGARTAVVFCGQINRIEALAADAEGAFATQQGGAPARLAEKVAQLCAAGAETPPERLAQELALLAVRADVREELDRLGGHVAAARALLAAKGPQGRKLDFLTQEFNREANTLCSKAASAALTAIGLDLKVVIDQMREQAANIE
ncbi:MAG: YicC/YloC family endoribonuclease [Paracoccaceae bacterium]